MPLIPPMARLGLTVLFAAVVVQAAEPQQSEEFSEMARLAPHSLSLDATLAGKRMVVVGDRGHILLSDDGGKQWRQVRAPSVAMLTGVFFIDEKHGWAVGHDETILRSEDGGESWARVHFAPEKQQPLLDVWFKDAQTGLAVGAYGAVLTTSDGGRNWTRQVFAPRLLAAAKPAVKPAKAADDEEYGDETESADRHLNKIASTPEGTLYMAAEAGHLFRSDDAGLTWSTLASPYEGSFFGVLPLDGAQVLAFGLRGHLLYSADGGGHWNVISTGTTAMLTDALRLGDGTVVISGLAGTLLVSQDGGRNFVLRQQANRKGIQALLPSGPRTVLTVGEAGIKEVSLNTETRP